MKLVLEITGEDESVAYRVVERFPVTLGRGYGSDVILHDPHVGESHLSLDLAPGGGWLMTDLGSVNATLLNGRSFRAASSPVSSGDTLRLGHTTLRVFRPDHPVPAPARAQRAGPLFTWLAHPRNVWAFFALAVGAVTAWSYATIWSEEPGLTLASASAAAAITVLVWAALWSVAGRLIRRRSFFMGHVALISLYLILGSAISWLSAAFDYVASENWLSAAAGYLMNAALLAALAYGSLSLATRLKERKRLLAALFFAAGLSLGVFTVSLISAGKFSPDPLYPYRLRPFLSAVAPADTAEEFMEGNAGLFGRDVFNEKEDE